MAEIDAEKLRKFEMLTSFHSMAEFGVPLDALAREVISLRAKLSRIAALCDSAAPPNQCLYADEGTDCESHCDCGWGELWHESVRAALRGDEW